MRLCSYHYSRGLPSFTGLRASLLAVAVLSAPMATAQDRPALIPVSTARSMASSETSRNPVRVRAIVTLHDRIRNVTFVQDGSGGLFVIAASAPSLSPGQIIEVSGTVVMSGRGPAITGTSFVVVGDAPLPVPQPLAVAAGRLNNLDGRLVAARGVVRRVESLWETSRCRCPMNGRSWTCSGSRC